MQVCNMWAKVTISVSVPQVPNLSILVAWMYCSCTGVTSSVVINKFHVVKNDPTNVHVLEFGPSYDVRNGGEKAVTVSCYIGLIARGSGGPKRTLGPPRVTLFALRNRRPIIKSNMLCCHSSSTE